MTDDTCLSKVGKGFEFSEREESLLAENARLRVEIEQLRDAMVRAQEETGTSTSTWHVLEDALRGTTKNTRCPSCQGSGARDPEGCEMCGGVGYVSEGDALPWTQEEIDEAKRLGKADYEFFTQHESEKDNG